MARGSSAANTAATSAQNFSNSLQGNLSGLYGEVAPALSQEVTNPTGYTPTEKAQMNTASQQSVGGSNAGAVGQGALLASRTKNAGAAQNAVAQSARTGGQTLSNDALKTEMSDANLKQKQTQAGLSGLEGLYGETLGGANQALGIVPSAVNANTDAASQSWDWAKYLLDPAMQDAASGASAYAKSRASGGG